MKEFVHLHVHTEYSLLDGANRIKDLIKRTSELGMKSIAITDHGAMYGVIDFYKEAKKHNVKPIIGCEVYTAKRTRFDKVSSVDSQMGHLVLLAKNNIGYQNLTRLVSRGFVEGFYYKPRIDFELLEKYSEGIIALSACLSGDISKAILRDNYEEAKEIAIKYNNIFGQDNFYIELQYNGIQEQNLVNQKLVTLSEETNIPLVVTNDAHYLRKEDAMAHEILLCIQTGKNINDEDRMKFSTQEFYIKTPEEMHETFKSFPQALENTVKIAERCNVEFEFGNVYLPEYDVPDGMDAYTYLKKLTYEGLKERYKEKAEDKKIIDRLEYELSVIEEMGYVDYFIIVWDFIKYSKDNGIMVGPGRGSAAGSIVAYTLGITNIEPLKYNLIFERFLNPERVTMPDIDIDFCIERRQEVIDYVVEKYGKDNVAQIITFGTMAARAAIRDVGRALAISYNEVDTVAKMIPTELGMNIEKALKLNPAINIAMENDSKIKRLVETAMLLEGMPRHASTHAAGVVISKDPIEENVPLQMNDQIVTTQFPMATLEELGLLKVDFLGLRTLTVLRDTLELIEKNHNKNIDIDKLDMDDEKVYKMISQGKTIGVFQLESSGMTQFMKELKPSNLEDIIAGISLYRPGPMEQIPRYIANKLNPENVEYVCEQLESILDVTYGCMVYQEQVMQIVRDLAGYSMGRADLVRRAMSKKKVDVMEEERKNFINGIVDDDGNVVVAGLVRNGIDSETGNKIFDEMMDFASYAFNKSHAAAYAVIAYQTAYFKYYYLKEFMAANLNSYLGNSDKISNYVHDLKTMNIDILPPHINESGCKFTVVESGIRFGMAAIKNVGEAAVLRIIEDRDLNGPFKDFYDFCYRISEKEVNKRCIESLIKCGALDSLGKTRAFLMTKFEKIIESINRTRKDNIRGQVSIFDLDEDNNDGGNDNISEFKDNDVIPEYPEKRLIALEKEMLGLYITGHPLTEFEKEINSKVNVFSKDLDDEDQEEDVESPKIKENPLRDGMKVTIGGIISSKKVTTTKNGSMMAFIDVEDMFGKFEVIVFSSTLERYSSTIVEDALIFLKGRLSIREDEAPKIICEEIETMRKVKVKKMYLRVDNVTEEEKTSMLQMLQFFNGNMPVFFYNEQEKKKTLLENKYWISFSDLLVNELGERIGSENVKIM